jgi:hypothetical protein
MSKTIQAAALWSKAKALVAALVPVATVVNAVVTDNEVTGSEWVQIGIALVGALGVYLVPNKGYVNYGGLAPAPSVQLPVTTQTLPNKENPEGL